MGKGSNPRNCFSKQFKHNYDIIQWDNPRCFNCNKKIEKEDILSYPESYISYRDGQISHKICPE